MTPIIYILAIAVITALAYKVISSLLKKTEQKGKKKIELTSNDIQKYNKPILINFSSEHESLDGHTLFAVMDKGVNQGRRTLSCIPMDLEQDNKGNFIDENKVYNITLETKRFKHLARNEFSDHREWVFLMPEDSTDLNSALRGTVFGALMVKYVDEVNYLSHLLDLHKQRDAMIIDMANISLSGERREESMKALIEIKRLMENSPNINTQNQGGMGQ